MKKIIAILAMLCVAAAAGCNNGNTEATTQSTSEEPAVTTAPSGTDESTAPKKTNQIVYTAPQKPDTTDQTLDYLESNVPLFYNYLTARRSVPLVFEGSVTKDGKVWETGAYIKDSRNFVEYAKDPDGNVTRVIYKDGSTYQVETANKTAYSFNFSDDQIKEAFENTSMAKLYMDVYANLSYTTDTAEYNGKEYDRVSITDGSSDPVEYYFDKTTGALAYLVDGDNVTEIKRMESVMPDESLFDIPADYEQKTSEQFYKEQIEAESTAQPEDQPSADAE